MNDKIQKLKEEISKDESKLSDYLAKADKLKQRIASKRKKLAEIESAVFLDYIREHNITLEQLMSLNKDEDSNYETVMQQDCDTETVETDSDIFSENSLFDFDFSNDETEDN